MKSEVIKNKKSLTGLRTVKNAIKMYTTLGDILKQAGIKESKPKYEGKATKNKNNKTKKNNSKKIYSEDYMVNQNPADRIKKLQKPLKNYVVPYTQESSPKEVSIRENISRDPKGFSEDFSERIQDKETIFVSLDFIEDCQKYKRKIRKGNWRLKSQRKGVKNIFRNQGKNADKMGDPQKFQESKDSVNNPLPHYENIEMNLSEGKKWEDKNSDGITENFLENPDKSDATKRKTGKELADGSPRSQSFSNKTSSDDVAKIDRKYLQSLLSCVRDKDEKVPECWSKQSDETLTQSQTEKKKKITGKDFFERKVKTKELHDENFSNIDDKGNKPREQQNESKDIVESQHSDTVSTRIFRALTKSEEQIKLKKAKNFYTYNNSNRKNKNVTYSKPDINDNRKKRKPRNKLMKNNVKEFIETSFPSEVSKVADVKELWRRETQKKSDNSLSSHSSCTVPESDEFPGSKNLESYKVLKKLVGEEINNIADKSENKTRAIKTKKNPNLANLKDSEQAKNICKALPASDVSNDLRANEKPIPQKRLIIAKCGEYTTAYDDKMQKSQKLNFIVQDIPQEANPKIKQLEEKAKQAGKLPGQVVENWSILNRLEQAFLGLGTPTFQKNIKDSNAPKGKHSTGKETSQISHSDRLKESKRSNLQKSKVTTSPGSTNSKKQKDTSAKITKPDENENNLRIEKDKHQSNKWKKDSKQVLQTDTRKTSKEVEHVAVQMKKKSQIRPDTSLIEKKSFKTKPPNSKRERNEEPKHGSTSKTQMFQKSKIQKLSKTGEMHLLNLNQIKMSEQNLERKKTFNVISVMDASINQPQGNKNCGKNNETKLSQTNNKYSKTDVVFLEKLKNEANLRSTGNDAGTKLPFPPKIPIKNPIKDKLPQMCNNPKVVGEKKNLKPSKLPINRIYQEHKNERLVSVAQAPSKAESNKNITNNNDDNSKSNNENSIGDVNKINENNNNTLESQQQQHSNDNNNNKIIKKENENDSTIEKPLLAIKKDSNNTLRERAVKKRSILSVHLNQTPRKLVKIKEKDNSDCTLENTQSYLNSARKQLKTSYSNVSVKNMDAYDKSVRNDVTNNDSEFSVTKTHERVDILPRLTSSSVNSSFCYTDQDQGIELGRGESNSSKPLKPQPLWEQDISHYHTIVREIMSQYKRIDGFLKQSEHFTNFSNDSVSFATLNDFDDKSNNSFNNSLTNDIDEYRKKIILEYTELPIFEYKSKLQESKNGDFYSEGTRKNLSVVKDSNTDTDLDVKDYQPNIQKVLDSQLYVDTERLAKLNEPKVKFKEKKSSLQEILTSKNEKTFYSEDSIRSCSAPKTVLSRNSPIMLFSARTFSSIDKSLGCLTSASMTGYSQETDSESFRKIIGK